MLNSRPIPTNRSLSCPICENTNGNCRILADDTIFCHSFVDARKGEKINGFVCVKPSNTGHTATFKPSDENWADGQRQFLCRSPQKPQKKAEYLPVATRNEQYRRISVTLGLNAKHRCELSSKRGLNNDEIDFALNQGWICSWNPGQVIDGVSTALAGVGQGVDPKLRGVPGVGIAAVDHNGLLTGFQIASDNREKFGKYLWLSSSSKGGSSPHLPSGELPIFVWRHPEAKEIKESWLVEGSLKSLITALKLWSRCDRKDIQVIGAAGANWLGSINATVQALGQTNKVVLCPDAGSLSNTHISGNYRKIIDDLTSRDYLVDVAWWGQFEKGKQLDIDELSNTLDFQLITPREFLKLKDSPQKTKSKVDDDWKLEYEIKRAKVAKFKFTRKPDIIVESGYLPTCNLNSLPQGITALKGDWGSGKSTFIANISKQWDGRKLQIAHLNSILYNTAPKYDLMHHHEVKELTLSLTSVGSLAICDVSFAAKFSPENWAKGEPFILIWDEVCQGLKSLHFSPNLRGKLRVQARIKIEWMIKNATYIILADRDLDDETLAYIERVRGVDKSFIIHHTAKKGLSRKPIIINNNRHKDEVLSHLIKDAKAGLKCVVACETKSDLVALERQIKEAGIDEEMMFVAHGDNSNEPHIKPVIEDIDKVFTDYQILGYTMTMGTAVSLEKPHFDCLYGFFTGDVLEASDQAQMLARYRPECTKTMIWVSPKKRTLDIDSDKLLQDLKIKIDATNKHLTSIDDVVKLQRHGILPNAWGEITEQDLPYIHHKLNIKARINASKANPFQSLYDLLTEAGFTIKVHCSDRHDASVKTDEGENHSEIKKEVREDNDKLIADAQLMDDIEFESAKVNAGSLNKAERDRLQKTQLHRETGLEITQDIVRLERTKKLRNGARLLKVLLGDEATAAAYDLADRERNPDKCDQAFYSERRRFLKELKLPELIDKLRNGWTYTNETPEIEAVADKLRKHRVEAKRLLGFNVSLKKNSKGGFVVSNSSLFGQCLDAVCVLRNSLQVKGQKNRIYSLDTEHWARLEAIMAHMDTLTHTPTLPGMIDKLKAEYSATTATAPNIDPITLQSIPQPQPQHELEQFSDQEIQVLIYSLGLIDNVSMLADLVVGASQNLVRVATAKLQDTTLRNWITRWLDYWESCRATA